MTKKYRLRHQKPFLAKELVRLITQRPVAIAEHVALQDVSFEVQKGESVGVVGHNGAGKSTLLGLLAGTSYPSWGTVEVEGRVGPLLELGAGFHPELTGYENIYLNGLLLGLTPGELRERLDSIAAYADLGAFLDTAIHTYSTGMRARLGFAVVAHVDPEVLLFDEILGVGDFQFRTKCKRTIEEFRQSGKTMFVVSHDLGAIRELCTRAIWIERGKMKLDGPSDEVVAAYSAA